MSFKTADRVQLTNMADGHMMVRVQQSNTNDLEKNTYSFLGKQEHLQVARMN